MRFLGDVVRTFMVNLSYEVELLGQVFFTFLADIAFPIKKSRGIKLNR